MKPWQIIEGKYEKYSRGIKELLAKVDDEEIRRLNDDFTSHGARVGGVTTLTKSGLDFDILKMIANWSDGSVQHVRYTRMIARDPFCVQDFPFYCPYELRNRYRMNSA